MANQSTRTDISIGQVAKYSKASAAKSVHVADTIAIKTEVRTVVTRAIQGNLELRFTPRDPIQASAKTSP